MGIDEQTDNCCICGEAIDLGFQWAARYQSRGSDPAGAITTTYGRRLKAHAACIAANRAVYVSPLPLDDTGA